MPTLEAMLDHIDYVSRWSVGGASRSAPIGRCRQTVCTLEAVFLSMKREYAPREAGGAKTLGTIDIPSNLIGFDDYRDFQNITRGLVARGCADEEIRGILSENFLRVFEAVCG